MTISWRIDLFYTYMLEITPNNDFTRLESELWWASGMNNGQPLPWLLCLHSLRFFKSWLEWAKSFNSCLVMACARRNAGFHLGPVKDTGLSRLCGSWALPRGTPHPLCWPQPPVSSHGGQGHVRSNCPCPGPSRIPKMKLCKERGPWTRRGHGKGKTK